MIPDDVIADIKARADIGAIIGRTVKLKRTGKNLVGLCPFHTEKTPSFNVSPDEGFYYCFGCKAAGDVVEFLVRSTGRGFLDIVTDLAQETGTTLPDVALDPEQEARQKERKRLLRVLELSQVYFRTRLTGDAGVLARAYLKDQRHFDDDAIERFGIGYAGADDAGLVSFLAEQGIGITDAVDAGVARQSDHGAHDFFRHRVTFPIRGLRGEVLSFSGRIFGNKEVAPDGKKRPKYINGPQTPVYDKSTTLYGLHDALPALKRGDPCVLVEGAVDAIAMYRAGLTAAVAPCGTSLTPRHVEEIKKRSERVILCLDADAAGKAAAQRAALMMLGAELDVAIAQLPDKDPDAMVAAGRQAELRDIVKGAPGFVDDAIAKARAAGAGSVRARVAAIESLLPILAAPRRELVRKNALRACAAAFMEDEAVLEREVQTRGRKLLGDKLRGQGVAGAPNTGRALPPRATPARLPSATTSTAANTVPDTAAATRAPEAAPTAENAKTKSNEAAPPPPQRVRREPATRRTTRTPIVPFSTSEVTLTEALLTHPELAALCGVLPDALENKELAALVMQLIDLLVRYHDEPAHDLLNRVLLRPQGEVVRILAKLEQAGGLSRPDQYLPLETARRIVEDTLLTLDRAVLEARIGQIQPLIAETDVRGDTPEAKRLLTEQASLRRLIAELDGQRHEGQRQLTARAPAPALKAAAPDAQQVWAALSARADASDPAPATVAHAADDDEEAATETPAPRPPPQVTVVEPEIMDDYDDPWDV